MILGGRKMHPFVEENGGKGLTKAYLELIVNGSEKDRKAGNNSIYRELARLELISRGVDCGDFIEENFRESIKSIYDRIDCFDFVLPGFIYIMAKHGDSPAIPNELRDEAKEMILGCKYWIDEGGPEKSPCYFTENHQMLYHSNEYIAGQLYKDEVFTNNGQTGKWHMEHARPFVLRWLEWRFRFGFCEWLSNNYYHEDVLSTSLLYCLAEDEEIRTKAAMVIDLILFDMALNSYKGVFGSSHGRTYCQNITNTRDGSFVLRSLFLGIGDEDLVLSPAAVQLACSDYKAAGPIVKCALDESTYENIQCMSMNAEEGAALGVDPLDYDNVTYFWGMGSNNHRLVVDNTLKTKAAPGYYAMERARAMKEHYDLCEAQNIPYDKDGDYTSRPKADLYSYKTKDYMLACVQDHKKGKYGFQAHIWQASLGGKAVVFSNHPATEEYTGRPNKWAGNRINPKTVQHRNVVISMYNTPVDKVPTYTYHTHAYIPQEFLDETVEKDGWVFGRKEDGYFAIRPLSGYTSWAPADPSYNPYMGLKKEDDEGKPIIIKDYEYIATGRSNVWVCEMGSLDIDGTFAEFMKKFIDAKMEGDVFGFRYVSPSLGIMETGWSRPFRVAGEEIRTDYRMRYDNPWCKAGRGTTEMEISDGKSTLKLDFKNTRRTI
ncbi:MAG TPA: hypothetical protein P5315_03190 [Clostridia bacterium]|nr:hypothetical protein [Clostridia bacterium]